MEKLSEESGNFVNGYYELLEKELIEVQRAYDSQSIRSYYIILTCGVILTIMYSSSDFIRDTNVIVSIVGVITALIILISLLYSSYVAFSLEKLPRRLKAIEYFENVDKDIINLKYCAIKDLMRIILEYDSKIQERSNDLKNSVILFIIGLFGVAFLFGSNIYAI
jgi:hypothetical protein